MLRLLDRLLTRKVACRNCPHYRFIGYKVRNMDSKRYAIGVCANAAPVMATVPKLTEAMPITYPLEWCRAHPLYVAKISDDLVYAPGAEGTDEHAGFNRAPTIDEALAMAPRMFDNMHPVSREIVPPDVITEAERDVIREAAAASVPAPKLPPAPLNWTVGPGAPQFKFVRREDRGAGFDPFTPHITAPVSAPDSSPSSGDTFSGGGGEFGGGGASGSTE